MNDRDEAQDRRAQTPAVNAPHPLRSAISLAAILIGATLLPASVPLAQRPEVRMLVQSSLLAGFQYYQGKQLWDKIKVGDPLTLVREPANPHDSNAVRVEWQGHKLGYVPRRENEAVARHMDGGGKAEARVSKLTLHRDPRQRIEFEVFVRL